MKHENDFVSTKEAAKIVGLSHRTLQDWRCENKKNGHKPCPDLKHAKIGGKILYFKKSLLDFIKRNTTGTE
jgi:hypothetical protein